MLAHCPSEPVVEHRLWLHGSPQPLLWPGWTRPHLGVPWVLCLAPALCTRNPWQPCLQVITLGTCSFSPVAEVAHHRPAGPLLEGAWGCVMKGMPATWGVFGRVSWVSWGVTLAELRMLAGVPAKLSAMRVPTGTGVMESVPSDLGGSSDSSATGRAPRAADVGCLLGMLH